MHFAKLLIFLGWLVGWSGFIAYQNFEGYLTPNPFLYK